MSRWEEHGSSGPMVNTLIAGIFYLLRLLILVKKQIPRPKLILFPRNETETKLPNAKWLTSSIS